jgi:hypothetical protein
MNITVKRQTEQGSNNWGVYVNGVLREGGFFNAIDAKCCAADWASEIAAEQAAYDEMVAFEERFVSSMKR